VTYSPVLKRLLDEHARIRALADQLEAVIAGRRPDDATIFWRLRWSILSLILQNWRHQRAEVMEPLLRDPRAGVAALAEEFNADLAEISRRYLDHIIRWDSDEGMADWTLYGDQVQPLFGVLRDRLEREERLLFPLLETAG
jgi:hypothetical protein